MYYLYHQSDESAYHDLLGFGALTTDVNAGSGSISLRKKRSKCAGVAYDALCK